MTGAQRQQIRLRLDQVARARQIVTVSHGRCIGCHTLWEEPNRGCAQCRDRELRRQRRQSA